MARHPILRNGGNLAPRDRIDDPECLVAFIRDKQQSVSGFGLSPITAGDCPHAENSEHGQGERRNEDVCVVAK